MKQFKLTEEERVNGVTRASTRQMMGYLTHLINQDINGYVDFVVKKRLGLTPEEKVEIDWEKGDVTLEETVVKPTDEDIAAIAREAKAGGQGAKAN